MIQEFSRDVSFEPQDKPYNCKLCNLTLRYNENLRSVFVVNPENSNEIVDNHKCVGIQNIPMPSLFEQKLDPLEIYQKHQQYSLPQQRRKETEEEEQKRVEAGRRHLAEINNKKNDSKNSEASMLKIQLEITQKRILELEDENTKLKRENINLKQKH